MAARIALAKEGDKGAVEAIVSAYLPMIHLAVSRFFVSSGVFSKEELVQSGVLGFMRAIQGYRREEGKSLGAYAMPWIMGEIRRAIRQASESTMVYSIRSKINREQERLFQQNGREPTIVELAKACSMTEFEVSELIALNVSVSENVQGEDELSIFERINVSGECVTDIAEIRIALDALGDDERRLIMLRYFRDLTQSQAAAALGKSQAQISRIERRALDHLRQLLE